MKLVVGLGNPGRRYHGTRHNIGFAVVDELARRRQAAFESGRAEALIARCGRGPGAVLLVKPLTFMNLSGEAVGGRRAVLQGRPGGHPRGRSTT